MVEIQFTYRKHGKVVAEFIGARGGVAIRQFAEPYPETYLDLFGLFIKLSERGAAKMRSWGFRFTRIIPGVQLYWGDWHRFIPFTWRQRA